MHKPKITTKYFPRNNDNMMKSLLWKNDYMYKVPIVWLKLNTDNNGVPWSKKSYFPEITGIAKYLPFMEQ